MSDHEQFGVTADGFVIKGLDRIVADQQARARAMFGDDVDLSSGSALRKVLDAVAVDVHRLWRSLEDQYYANFVTTAQGPDLDLLGTDLGISRRNLQAHGEVAITLTGATGDRGYVLPHGTVMESDADPPISYRTTEQVTLSAVAPEATVGVRAVERGPAGNLVAGQPLRLNPDWAGLQLDLGPAAVEAVTATNIAGGELLESDAAFRARLLGVPRTVWTREALLAQILDVPGVRDVAIFDPLGGADTSQRMFGTFRFGQGRFTPQRPIGSPYFFDVVVATEPGWPWTAGEGNAPAVHDAVLGLVREWRPVSIFPNILRSNQVDIGLHATLMVEPGHSGDTVRGEILEAVRSNVNRLRLGRSVLYSDIMLALRAVAGVVDVQNLRLRRFAPAFARVHYAGAVFGHSEEPSVGQNLLLAFDEIAYFSLDSPLIDIQVVNP